MSDRRALVFFIFSVVCFVLVPVAEPEHRWVAIATSVVYALLATASALDARSRSRR